MTFVKMQGLGNDYLYFDCTKEMIDNPSELALRLSNRNFGAGSDGIILICPSEVADFRMDMYNEDGSQGKMCGNGIRCVGKFVHDRGLTDKTTVTVETLSGIKVLDLTLDEKGMVKSVRVDMGEPELASAKIPTTLESERAVAVNLNVDDNDYTVTCVSMGNPHCVIFTDEDIDGIELDKIGPKFEHNAVFPDRVNTEFVNLLPDGVLKMRVWERGSGETLACGTGACAVFTAAVLCGVIKEKSGTVRLRGGDLFIEWGEDNHIYMTGPAEFVYEGKLL